jgi:hypothetical protein
MDPLLPLNTVLVIHRPELGPCWVWQGNRDQDGYGIVKVNGKNTKLHRLMYRLFVGPLFDLQLVLHRCDNPPCCNPSHLRAGTDADNIADCCQKFRNAFGVRNNKAKLTDDKVVALRAAYNSGFSSVYLAHQEGMSTSTMQNVLFGRSWKHVPGACTPRPTGSKTGRKRDVESVRLPESVRSRANIG